MTLANYINEAIKFFRPRFDHCETTIYNFLVLSHVIVGYFERHREKKKKKKIRAVISHETSG